MLSPNALIKDFPPKRDFVYAPPSGPLPIIAQGEDYILIDKPAGLLSVPGKTEPDCAEARLRAVFPEARTVHRLDMATSGLMIFALTHHAQRHLGLQFENRQMRKQYLARVDGEMAEETGEIDLPMIADWPNRPRQMIDFERGKSAVTRWEALAREGGTTRVALFPKTGRSHQLRLHLASIGHPILGDRIYAQDAVFNAAETLQLHAAELGFREPTGGAQITATCPCPF